MANAMLNEPAAQAGKGININHALESEQDHLIAEAYAKGRSDAFAFLGLDETDFPQGDGLTAWTV